MWYGDESAGSYAAGLRKGILIGKMGNVCSCRLQIDRKANRGSGYDPRAFDVYLAVKVLETSHHEKKTPK